jgi:hypothetical protein
MPDEYSLSGRKEIGIGFILLINKPSGMLISMYAAQPEGLF